MTNAIYTFRLNDFPNPDFNKINILKILNSKGSTRYDELRNQCGFETRRGSGIFAYQLEKLLGQSLIAHGKSKKEYIITSLGKLVLNLDKKKTNRL